MRYLKEHGLELLDNGFNVIPIAAGRKAPLISGWSKIETTEKHIKEWIRAYPDAGVGINTRYSPAIDIDCHDEEIVNHMVDYCEDLLGYELPARRGLPPKILLLCSTHKPFNKVQSSTFVDEYGDLNKLEILCDGQQFVAYHIHPDTKKPYKWISDDEPLTVHADDLPHLSEKNARLIVNEFERVVRDRTKWKVKGTSIKKSNNRSSRGGSDDPFSNLVEPISMDPEVLRNHLMTLDSDDYDTWYKVGMALHHQFSGGYEGLDMWNEWSATSDKFKSGICDKKWPTLNDANKGVEPITARFILHLAKEVAKTTNNERLVDISESFARCRDYEEWDEIAAEVRKMDISQIQRATIVTQAKQARDRISGTRIPISEIRKVLSYQVEVHDTPKWCSPFVYVNAQDKFLNLKNKELLTKTGFDANFNRFALTKKEIVDGKTRPANSASDLALNIYKIEIVSEVIYSPKQDLIFRHNGLKVANSFDESQFAPIPERLTSRDKANLKIVQDHFKHIVEDERERDIFISWLASIIQNPGEIARWAVLIQGIPGDGKSFFASMMVYIMGLNNAKMLNATSFTAQHTGWAHGQCFLAVEEIRLKGVDKYAILDKIKPFISNSLVEIHPKYGGQITIENTTNYLLFTNYRDALPINDDDRRYFIIFSKWQSPDAIREFTEKNPNYFPKLFDAIKQSAGAIREWLLDYELCDEFVKAVRAPLTEARNLMIMESQPEEIQDLMQIILKRTDPLLSEELLSLTRYNNMCESMQGKHPRNVKAMLQHAGFFKIRGKVKIQGRDHYFYSKKPDKFTEDGTPSGWIDGAKVRKFISENDAILDEDEDDVWND